jgi:hypothetical protein
LVHTRTYQRVRRLTGRLANGDDQRIDAASLRDIHHPVSGSTRCPGGFRSIPLTFVLDSDAGDDELEKLIALTERHCVVCQTIVAFTPVQVARK